jgi:N-acyl homoserine lactone hydrolase
MTRLYILPLGYIENDIALNLLLYNQANIDDKHKISQWHRVPSFCLLIQHNKLGNVLVDCGSHPKAMEGFWPEKTRKSIPLIRQKEDMLDYRLSQLNLTPGDIDLLILTHLHLDHAGGLTYFQGTKAGSKVIAHVEEIKQALYDPFINNDQIAKGYHMPDFTGLDGIRFDPIVESITLADDFELLWLPGHTAGTIGILVNLKNSGSILYTSDAVNWEPNLYPEIKLSAVFHDSLEMEKSMVRIKWIQRRYQSRLIFGHDLNQYNQLKLAPENYYD